MFARSLAGSSGVSSRYLVGGCQLSIFEGNGSKGGGVAGGDMLLVNISPVPPPPQPERNDKRIKIEKSAIGCLPDFAKLPSSNDVGRARGVPRRTRDFFLTYAKMGQREFQLCNMDNDIVIDL